MDINVKIEAQELATAINNLAKALTSANVPTVKSMVEAKEIAEEVVKEAKSIQISKTESLKAEPIKEAKSEPLETKVKPRKKRTAKKEEPEEVKTETNDVKSPELDEPTEQDLRNSFRDRLKAAASKGAINKHDIKNVLTAHGLQKISEVPINEMASIEQEIMNYAND